jgi:hypothetical protein
MGANASDESSGAFLFTDAANIGASKLTSVASAYYNGDNWRYEIFLANVQQ